MLTKKIKLGRRIRFPLGDAFGRRQMKISILGIEQGLKHVIDWDLWGVWRIDIQRWMLVNWETDENQED
jgi:hypothetical protein